MTVTTFYFDPVNMAVLAYQKHCHNDCIPIVIGDCKQDYADMATNAIAMAFEVSKNGRPNASVPSSRRKCDMSPLEVAEHTWGGRKISTLTSKQKSALDDFTTKLRNNIKLNSSQLSYLFDIHDKAHGLGSWS